MSARTIALAWVLLGVIVSTVWLATRFLAEPRAPLGNAATTEHGSKTPPVFIVAVPEALPQTGNQAAPASTQRVAAISLLSQSSLTDSDKGLLARVNFYLKEDGLEPIDPYARIHPDDLEVLREVVAANMEACERAEHKWLRHGTKILAGKRAAAFERLKRGDADNLPIMGADNKLSRRHPHEVICQTVHLGVNYVFRVHPDEDPDLATLGAECASAHRSQVQDFDSLIRDLFRVR